MQFLGLMVRAGRKVEGVFVLGVALPQALWLSPLPHGRGVRGSPFCVLGFHVRPSDEVGVLEPLGAPSSASGGLFSSLLSKRVVC